MNIFVLDQNPQKAAQIQIDCAGRYGYKLILESAQMLSTAMRSHGYSDGDIYKSAYVQHPCTVWVRESRANALWTIEMSLEMCRLYTERTGKVYASQAIIERCLELVDLLPDAPLTPPALAVNSTSYGIDAQVIYKDLLGTWEGAVKVYRYFYYQSKHYLNCCVL